jgi:hypothetical protein
MRLHHSFRALPHIVVTFSLALATGACGIEVTPTTPTSPSTPTTTRTTEEFSGSLAPLGSSTQTWAVSATGTVDVTLTSVAPLATLALGVEVGTWNGTTCSVITKNDNARAGAVALTGVAAAGNYCVTVYDSGNVAADATVTYTVQVLHP